MLLDYILELNKKGYRVTSQLNPIFCGIDIDVQKDNFISRQTINFDTLDEVDMDKEDIIKIIIEELARKVDEGSK